MQTAMPIRTTVIGVYPKPDYLPIPVWYREGGGVMDCTMYDCYIKSLTSEQLSALEVNLEQAEFEVIAAQCTFGLDVITDGEVYRDNYLFHFLRHLEGVDFKHPESVLSDGPKLPVISGKVKVRSAQSGFSAKIWAKCQTIANTIPVKATLPGPMTLTSMTFRRHYKSDKEQCLALAECIKSELKILALGGCKYIQIDETAIAQNPEEADDYEIDILTDILSVLPADVHSTVHICCGYTSKLDEEDAAKSDPKVYRDMASRLDHIGASAISIEGAGCDLDLSVLKLFKKSEVVLGVVAIGKSKVETREEISERIQEAVQYIPSERLWLAPDCGLGLLPVPVLNQKLSNMVAAAQAYQ